MYRYYQLLDEDYNDLIAGNDNPANIADGENGQTAAKIARQWMREAGVKTANLITNGIQDGDNILSVRCLTI